MKKIIYGIVTLLLGLLFSIPAIYAQDDTPEPSQEVERTYELFVPESYDDSQPTPLLIVLHGASGDGAGIQSLTEFDVVAEGAGFIVVYPDSVGPTWAFSGVARTSEGIVSINEPQFLADLIDDLAAEYNIDTGRVFLTGHSDGATLAYWFACVLPEKVAGVAAVSAPLSVVLAQNCAPDPLSVLIIHGTSDPILTWDTAYDNEGQMVALSIPDTFSFWVQHNGCDIDALELGEIEDTNTEDETLVRTARIQNCEAGSEVMLYGVGGGGHTWPGHPFPPTIRLGPTNMDIDATQVILDWFAGLEQSDSD